MSRKWVVTGASGFLGGRLMKDLYRANPNDIFLGTGRRNERKEEFESLGLQFVSGNLEDPAFCKVLLKDAEIVIHCAALSSPWGPYEHFYNANVKSTQHLYEASRELGVKKFILISTPSIYITGQDRLEVSEEDALPNQFVNHYAATKYLAEKFILERHSEEMPVISFRPRAIIGAEDTVIFPRMIRAYEEGKLKIIGSGENVVDLCSADNIAAAIRQAMEIPEAWGEAYNLTDGEPGKLWYWINDVLQKLGYDPIKSQIPFFVAYNAARFMEWRSRTFQGGKEPVLTKYSIQAISRSFTLDITKAKDRFGYAPVVSTNETLDRFIDWYLKLETNM